MRGNFTSGSGSASAPKPPASESGMILHYKLLSINIIHYYPLMTIFFTISAWWYTYPSEKYEFVSWDDEIPK